MTDITDKAEASTALMRHLSAECAGLDVKIVMAAATVLLSAAICRNRNTVVDALKLADQTADLIRDDIRRNFGSYRYPSKQ